MYRFFEKIESLSSDKIYLSEKNTRHINVIRINSDEIFEIVIDDEIFDVQIDEFSKKNIVCKVLTKRKEEDNKLKINLYQGLPKSDKLELIIQKATELGISKIIPFISSRSVVKWDSKKESKKIERYSEIAQSASEQSKRITIPIIKESINFDELCESIKNQNTILAYENYGENLSSCLDVSMDTVNIIIGPEGGFSEEEVLKLKSFGAKVVNLGKRILRTETAAIVLVGLVQYEIGDIDEKI